MPAAALPPPVLLPQQRTPTPPRPRTAHEGPASSASRLPSSDQEPELHLLRPRLSERSLLLEHAPRPMALSRAPHRACLHSSSSPSVFIAVPQDQQLHHACPPPARVPATNAMDGVCTGSRRSDPLLLAAGASNQPCRVDLLPHRADPASPAR
nr:uncharacterized protein LOC120969449 [Aegilops tauschii subsp. strangulata]